MFAAAICQLPATCIQIINKNKIVHIDIDSEEEQVTSGCSNDNDIYW